MTAFTTLTRAELGKLFPQNPKAVLAFEDQQRLSSQTAQDLTDSVASTAELQAATVVTLSSNDALANERVLAVGSELRLEDSGPGGRVVIRMRWPIETQGGYRLTFNTLADTNLTLPSNGTVVVGEAPYFPNMPSAANDAAAAALMVPVGGLYHTAGVVHVRLA